MTLKEEKGGEAGEFLRQERGVVKEKEKECSSV